MSNSADKDVDLSGVNPKLRAQNSRNKSSKLREAVAYLSPKSQRTPMDKDSVLDHSNKRNNAELYASPNNKSNQTTLGKNNATTTTKKPLSNIGKVPKLTGARKVTSSTKKKSPSTAIDNGTNTIKDTLKNTDYAIVPEDTSSMLCNLVKSDVAEVLPIAIRTAHISLLQSPEKCNTNHMKEKIWPQHIYNNQYANPSIDGTFIECLICKGKGRVRGEIVMRRLFQTINWDSAHGHVNTKGHIISMDIVEAEKNQN